MSRKRARADGVDQTHSQPTFTASTSAPVSAPAAQIPSSSHSIHSATSSVRPTLSKSTRAFSRRNRVYTFREFIKRQFPSLTGVTVLDMAGGKGHLSWLLSNLDGADAIVTDPRVTDHRHLIKSVAWLRSHPEEAKRRAVKGLPTHQPLAALLDSLPAVDTDFKVPRSGIGL